jgi:hypothetical protein
MSTEPSTVEKEKVPKKEWKSQHENDAKAKYGGRDMAGYSGHPPNPHWPRSAKVALNFVINYEEGSETCLLHGDGQSEHLLSDIVGAQPVGKFRDWISLLLFFSLLLWLLLWLWLLLF